MLLLLGLLRVAIVQNFMFMVGFEAVQDLGFLSLCLDVALSSQTVACATSERRGCLVHT